MISSKPGGRKRNGTDLKGADTRSFDLREMKTLALCSVKDGLWSRRHPGGAFTVRSLYPIEVSDLAHSCDVWVARVRLSVRAEHVL